MVGHESVEEISEVQGIGEAGDPTYDDIISLITVGETEEPESEEGGGSSAEFRERREEERAGLQVQIEGSETAVVGAPVRFRASANHRLRSRAYAWSFGDGSVATGAKVEHVYAYAGEYTVVLRGTLRELESAKRLNIKVVLDSLKISHASPERIEVHNSSTADVDLYGRSLVSGGKTFAFPQDTIIRAGQKISFPSAITGLNGSGARIALASEPVYAERPSQISEEDRKKISSIESDILSLQIKQMEIRKAENLAQVAAPIVAVEPISSSSDIKIKKSWFSTIKKFFGFR